MLRLIVALGVPKSSADSEQAAGIQEGRQLVQAAAGLQVPDLLQGGNKLNG